MYKTWIVILIFTSFIFILACNSNQEAVPEEKNVRMRAGNVPMSELANMMRDMQELSEELKILILNNDTSSLPGLSFNLQEMKTVEATDMTVKDELFNVYTDHFDKAFAELYKEEMSKIDAYNSMIESCLSCHQQYCSGPMKMISALKIEEETASGE